MNRITQNINFRIAVYRSKAPVLYWSYVKAVNRISLSLGIILGSWEAESFRKN
jgi:hypothetical protein